MSRSACFSEACVHGVHRSWCELHCRQFRLCGLCFRWEFMNETMRKNRILRKKSAHKETSTCWRCDISGSFCIPNKPAQLHFDLRWLQRHDTDISWNWRVPGTFWNLASRNRCLTTRSKKLLGTSATLVDLRCCAFLSRRSVQNLQVLWSPRAILATAGILKSARCVSKDNWSFWIKVVSKDVVGFLNVLFSHCDIDEHCVTSRCPGLDILFGCHSFASWDVLPAVRWSRRRSKSCTLMRRTWEHEESM